jgi:predicted nucleic acid-binding protein
VILADTGVWIDLFADRKTPQTDQLTRLVVQRERLAVGDLVLTEVLQGTRDERDLRLKLSRLSEFDRLAITGSRVAVEAARNYQRLRALGITPRKTIDTLIATRCIVDDVPLLFADRDFLPFVEHLGLRSALDDIGLT